MAEAPKILAIAALGLAAVLLVPTFNALNEARVLDAKPPIEIKDPPPDVEPPPDFEPPPVPPPPPCQPGSRTLYDTTFNQPGGSMGDSETFVLPVGTASLGIGVRWANYRGDASVTLTAPDGNVAFADASAASSTLLAPKSGEKVDELAPQGGDWRLLIENRGIAGGFGVAAVALGCFPPEGASTGGA